MKLLYKLGKFLLSVVFIIMALVLCNIINDIGIIPNKYFMFIILGLFIDGFTCCLFFISRSKVLNIISYIVSFISVIVLSILIFNAVKFSNFINNTLITKEVIEYNVVVLRDSSYSNISDLNDKSMGYLNIGDLSYLEGIDTIKESYDNVYFLYDDLSDKNIESMIVNSAYLDLLSDEYRDIYDRVRIVHTFTFNVNKSNNDISVDKLDSINILISGSDTRSSNVDALGRSDVNMILSINPKTHKILLTSIPRDYYVQLHDTTGLKDKLTHAGIYGVDMSRTTLEDLFEIKIDYSIKVGFNSVVELVDLIGGVDIDSPIEFNSSHKNGWVVKKGINHMNGEEALAYSRERYAYVDGDVRRIQNQQQVLEAIINKIASDKSLLVKYDDLLKSFSNLYQSDIPKDYLKLLVSEQLDNGSSWKVSRQHVTGVGTFFETYSMPGRQLYVMVPNMESVSKAKNEINKFLSYEK